MDVWLLLEAGLLPAGGALAAVVIAMASTGTPLRLRLRRLGDRLLMCVLLLAVLAAIAAAGRWMGWGGTRGGCQPSPNGLICEDE